MTKLSRAVIACISAIMMLPGAASIAGGRHFTYELNGSYAESNGGPSLGDHSGCGSWSHRGRWSSRPDLGRRWPSRLVATAEEDRLSLQSYSHTSFAAASDCRTIAIYDYTA